MENFEKILIVIFRFLQDTNFVIFMYELLVCCSLLHPRKNFYLRLALFIPFIIITNNTIGISKYINSIFLIGGMQFSYIIYFLLSILIIWFCFEEKFIHILYFCTAAYIIENMGSQIGNILNLSFFNGTPNVNDYNDTRPLFYYCIREIIEIPIFIIVKFLFVNRYKKNFDFHIKTRSIIITETFTLLIIVILNWYGTMFGYMNIVARIYAMIVDIILLLFQFAIFSETKLEYEKDITESLLKIQAHQQEQAKENTALINIKYHDLKRQIAALKVMDNSKNKESAIKELENATSFFETMVKTGNDALDIVLMEKAILFKQNSISFSFYIDGKLLNFMNSSDIYILFSNALDNAFESLMHADENLREVICTIEKKEEFVKVTLKNYCYDKLNFIDGLPITNKDKSYHGYGTKSIKLIVEKYNGLLSMSQVDSEFILKILFPIK